MREFKKVIAILLIAVMMLPYSSFAIGVRSDIGNHWAKVDIEYLLGKGVVSGYPDGTFRPDKQITRAEFITIVNSIFGYQDRGLVQFRDVRYGDWFYNEVATAVEAGYISGYVDGTIRPNNPITRQEASKIIGTVFDLEEVELKASEEFKDYFLIGSWAKGHVNALKKKGYLTGYRDGTFRPNNPITRAEAVKIIRNASGTIINTGGVYTSDAYGNVLVNTSNVILRDMDIKGDLYLVEGIGEGDVKLDNVTVEGNTYIRGGDNRITIRDSELGEVVINKKSGNVRVVLEGDTIVENMVIKSGTKLVVEEDAEVEEIEVDAKDVEIEAEGDIDLLIANEDVIVNDEKVKKHKKIAVDDGKVEEVDDRGRRIRDDELESVSISGEAVVGETLRARIRPKDATANYEWQWSNRRNGTYRDIRGADRSRYTLTEEDEGMWIRVKATGRRDYEGTVRSRAVYVEAAEPLPEREVLSKEAMGYDPNKVGAGVVDITGNGQVKITLKTILDETGYGVDNGRLTLDGKNFNYTDADKKASNGWANPQIAYVPVLVNMDKLGGYKDITSVKYDGKSGSVIIDSGKLYINIPVAENSANPASEASVDDWSLLEEAATKVVILAEDSKGNEKEFIFTATTKETLVVPEPEVKGSIAWDPGKTGGENLNVIVEGSTIIFNGQIKWYSEDESLGRIAGNRVGVQITVPEGFDTASTTVKIGNNTYNWSEIEDGEGYFWWYPLITEAGEEFIAEVKWNEKSTQTFTVKISEDATLEPASGEEPGVKKARFEAINNFGINAGKVYAGYKLMTQNQQIDLIESNIESIKVTDPNNETTSLIVEGDSDPYLWFNVEKEEGEYKYTVVTKGEDQKTYEAILSWSALKQGEWKVTGREGEHNGKEYVEYKLLDGENIVSLKKGEVKLIAEKVDGNWVKLVANTDSTLWFNKDNDNGSYEFVIVTRENEIYRAVLSWDKNIAEVSSLEELIDALDDPTKSTINITKDIETTEKLLVSRPVEVNGGGKTIIFKGDTEGWQGNYVFHAYTTQGVTIRDIKLTGGDGGLLINGSEVTLTGTVDVSGNEFGGIEVSKGVNVTETSKLNVTKAELVNETEEYGLPTIWEDSGDVKVEGFDGKKITFTKEGGKTQIQYYLKAENAESPEHIEKIEETRIHEGSTKVSGIGFSAEDGEAILTLNYTLDEGGYITSEAKNDLDAQVPGEGANVSRGYHEIVAERPNNTVTHYAVEGLMNEKPWNIEYGKVVTVGGKVGARWYLYVAEKVEESEVINWKPFGDEYTYTFIIQWYEDERLVLRELLTVKVEDNSQEMIPAISTYAFSYNVPNVIREREEVEIPVTFKAVEVGDYGYDNVRFKFETECVEGGQVTFKAIDSKDNECTFINEGVWGPSEGFNIPADYTAITGWNILFSEAGEYKITFKLIDVSSGKVIADITDSKIIIVKETGSEIEETPSFDETT